VPHPLPFTITPIQAQVTYLHPKKTIDSKYQL
jgi:hypothetical protein